MSLKLGLEQNIMMLKPQDFYTKKHLVKIIVKIAVGVKIIIVQLVKVIMFSKEIHVYAPMVFMKRLILAINV